MNADQRLRRTIVGALGVGAAMSLAALTVSSGRPPAAVAPGRLAGASVGAASAANATAQHTSVAGTQARTPSRTTSSTTAADYRSAVLADHPSLYYRLDESGGPTAHDSSGNGQDGQYQSVAYAQPGALVGDPNTAITSAGVAVTQSGATLPAGAAARTLEAWTFQTDYAQPLFSYGDVAGGHGFTVTLTHSGGSVTVAGDSGSAVTAGASPGLTGAWHLIDVSYDGATVVIFEDGQVIGSGPLTATTAVPGQGLSIDGASGCCGPDGIDEVAIYASALSTAQVNAHWSLGGDNRGAACPTTPSSTYSRSVTAGNPDVYFRLDELANDPADRVAFDSSGHCNNGAYAGATSTAGAMPGDSDTAIRSGGLAVRQSGNTLPSGSAPRTVEFWWKQADYGTTIVGYGDGAAGHSFSVGVPGNITQGQSLSVSGEGGTVVVKANPNLTTGWNLIDVTYDGSSVTVYENGNNLGGGPLALATVVPGQGLSLNGAGGCCGQSSLDEVAIYGSALSPGEIQGHLAGTGAYGLVGGALSALQMPADVNAAQKQTCYCQPQKTGHPVNAATGAFFHTFADAVIPGRGAPLDLTRTYSSVFAAVDGPFGFGWTDSYGMSLDQDLGTGVVTVHQENGAQITFTPSGGGYSVPPRTTATLSHNGDGSFTMTRNGTQVFTFAPGGQLTAESDLNGYVTALAYTSGRLVSVTEPAGRSLAFTYSGAHVASLTDPIGRVTSYAYDGSGNLASVVDPAGGHTTFSYDGAHQLLTMTDPRGGVVTNVYDAQGRVTSQSDPLGHITTFQYGGDNLGAGGGTTTITAPAGEVTVEHYQWGLRTSVTEGSGSAAAATWQFTYDPGSLGIVAETNPNGHTTTYTYDAQDNLSGSTDPLGRSTSYTYNSLGEPLTETDAKGTVTTTTYDSAGNVVSSSTPLNGSATRTTTYHYDDAAHPGDQTGMTDAGGATTTYQYDAAGDRIGTTDATGNHTSHTYDGAGREASMTSPSGRTTTYTYDALDDRTSVTDPLGHTTHHGYDGDRDRTSMTDPKGNVTTYTYDAASELTATTRADGSTPTTVYDADGRIHQQVDALGHATTYTYDALNRTTSVTDPLGRVTSTVYDGDGNVVSVTDGKGVVTSHTYDAADQLTATTYSDGTTPAVTGITYDADGQRIGMSDGLGASSWTYDALGRMTSSSLASGGAPAPTVGYQYDLVGRTTAITYPGGHMVTHGYDAAGRLTSVHDWLGATTAYTYDSDGEMVLQVYGNGVSRVTSYDAAGQVTGITYANVAAPTNVPDIRPVAGVAAGTAVLLLVMWRRGGRRRRLVAGAALVVLVCAAAQGGQAGQAQAAAPPLSFSYTRDAGNMVTGEVDTVPGDIAHSYTYTGLNQLSADNVTGYQYDAADNVTRVPAAPPVQPAPVPSLITYDAANQPQTRTATGSAETYTYDANGNRTHVAATGTAVAATYAYDGADRMTAFGSAATYAYSGDGLRMTKTVGATSQAFTWDVAGSLPTILGAGTTSYVTGLDGLPLEQVSATNQVLYYLPDQLGSTRALLDATGNPAGVYTYDAYGRTVAAAGTVTDPVFGFAGEYTDAESGLISLRARYYDPATAQFLTRDPVTEVTRVPYAYAEENPLNRVDPSGLIVLSCPDSGVCFQKPPPPAGTPSSGGSAKSHQGPPIVSPGGVGSGPPQPAPTPPLQGWRSHLGDLLHQLQRAGKPATKPAPTQQSSDACTSQWGRSAPPPVPPFSTRPTEIYIVG